MSAKKDKADGVRKKENKEEVSLYLLSLGGNLGGNLKDSIKDGLELKMVAVGFERNMASLEKLIHVFSHVLDDHSPQIRIAVCVSEKNLERVGHRDRGHNLVAAVLADLVHFILVGQLE